MGWGWTSLEQGIGAESDAGEAKASKSQGDKSKECGSNAKDGEQSRQVVEAGWLHVRQALVELPARAQADRPALLQALNSCLDEVIYKAEIETQA